MKTLPFGSILDEQVAILGEKVAILGEKVAMLVEEVVRLRPQKCSKWYADAFKSCTARFAVERPPREFLGRPGARY